jgi:hypothetical protein
MLLKDARAMLGAGSAPPDTIPVEAAPATSATVDIRTPGKADLANRRDIANLRDGTGAAVLAELISRASIE